MKLYLPNGQLKRVNAPLSDLTSKKRTGDPYWDPAAPDTLVVPFESEPTAAEAEAIRLRLTTATPAEEQLQRLGMAAVGADRAFRDTTAKQIADAATAIITDPANNKTNIQALAQAVKALTNQVESLSRQNIVLFRLALRLTDATD